ncbi:tricorn protease [Bryobacterales bacterium F-183]|nr:tricorn protease [Bryobacterales bacterium F-183]
MNKSFWLFLAATAALLADGRTLFRSPTVSKTHIVFVYADDLWIVPRAGGEAARLTSGSGIETNPIFSPDGQTIAFTGEYDGNVDVYTVPATGGVPKRLTFHPASDIADAWTPDGKQILFRNSGSWVDYKPRLFTVDLKGGFPTPVPLPIALSGSYSPDGKQLAYMPYERADDAWKRYRGGRATTIWIANLADSNVSAVPRTTSNDHTPMWIGNQVYFLSDRNGPYTLFSFDPASKKVTQLLEAKGLDIKSARGDGSAIAYEQFGSIYLYDLKSKKAAPVNITLNGDLAGVRPRIEKTGQRIASGNISPTGARAVVEARGDIYTIPAEKGDVRNLTNTSGVADRSPAWSPDGRWIAYFSDESGEYQLHMRDQTGRGEVKKFKLEDKPTFYYDISWAPDSKKLAYVDKKNTAWYMDIESGKATRIDSSTYDGGRYSIRPRWSPDSKWIAYNKDLRNHLSAVFVYSLADGKSTQITDGMSEASDAVFDRNGKYLYFLSSTDAGPSRTGLDMTSTNRPVSSNIYVAVLSKTEPSPLAPESDEEKVAPAASDEKKPEEKKPEGPKTVEVKIDFDGIGQRILPLPLPARNYSDLSAGKTGILFYVERPVIPAAATSPLATLYKFDLSKRKADVFLAGSGGYEVSANGEKILLSHGQGRWSIQGTAQPAKPAEGMLKLDQMEALVDPKAEWAQMFKEVWRIERDFFYDPKYHGLDLQAAAEKYGLYLSSVASRNDLNYLFREMLGELSVGHLFVSGGDNPNQPKRIGGGLLGADYAVENGRYKFARVYEGDNWTANTRAPLTQPGVGVKAGEYLLKVNGVDLRDSDNIYARFESTAGKAVLLTVGPNADGSGSRDVTVTPLGDEVPLRQLAWMEDNRKRVSEASGGKLAYMHLPDTAGGGYRNFNRYYFSQTDKQGVVIDERFNHGGQAADYIIDHLRRPVWNYWASREGEVYTTPGMLINGPKVMLANEYSGSGGDLLPWLFKRAKLGPVVGKRTWGGLVGIGGYPTLIDGGSVTAPHFAFFTPEGKWEVENQGTPVDVEVELDPKAWREGKDTQLERAIAIAMQELQKNPPVTMPKRPEYPNYHQTKGPGAGGTTAGAQ